MQPDDSRPADGDRAAAPAAVPAARSGIGPGVIVFILVALVGLAFFLGNGGSADFHFLFWDWTTTVRWMILLSIVLGIVLDRLFTFWWRRRSKRRAREKAMG